MELQKEFVKLLTKQKLDTAAAVHPQIKVPQLARTKIWRKEESRGLFKVPNQHVADALAISGKHGIIVDFDKRDSEDEGEAYILVKTGCQPKKASLIFSKALRNSHNRRRKLPEGLYRNAGDMFSEHGDRLNKPSQGNSIPVKLTPWGRHSGWK